MIGYSDRIKSDKDLTQIQLAYEYERKLLKNILHIIRN